MKTIFNILFIIAILCSFGFILNYLFLKMILFGVLGSNLQIFVLAKLRIIVLSWLNNNKLLIYFLIIYLILISTCSTIYLDSNNKFNIDLSNITVTVKDTFLELVFLNIGAGIAFSAGAKFTAKILEDKPMPIKFKIGASMLAASVAFIIFHFLNLCFLAIKYYLNVKKETEKSFFFHIKGVKISNLSNPELFNYLNDFSTNNKVFVKNQIVKQNPDNILEMTEKENLTEIFNPDNNTAFDTFQFNSPFENSENMINLYNELSLIFSYNLIIKIITVYFICMFTFFLIIKIFNIYKSLSR